MNEFENMLDEAKENNVEVIEKYNFNSKKIKGLYCNGTVALNKDIDTTAEKNSILSEELGHHHTTSGNIIDQSKQSNRKQEHRARLWAYNKMVGLSGIIRCHKHKCSGISEMADYLDVTEEFLLEAIECYKSKYGEYTKLDNYIIYFEPLGVLELYK